MSRRVSRSWRSRAVLSRAYHKRADSPHITGTQQHRPVAAPYTVLPITCSPRIPAAIPRKTAAPEDVPQEPPREGCNLQRVTSSYGTGHRALRIEGPADSPWMNEIRAGEDLPGFKNLAGLHPYPPTALIMSNIGRYMATTMPPMTMPMTTIMMGSSTEVSAATALSTSSS
jgi:hypothetical protein